MGSIPHLFSIIIFNHPCSHRICYRTCIRTFPNGTELCEAQEEEDEGAEPLPITLPSDPALSGMYFTTRLASPGFFSKKKYKNNAICRYTLHDSIQRLHGGVDIKETKELIFIYFTNYM